MGCLIFQKAAVEIAKEHGLVEAANEIENLPSVPAVPLDKLCEWLEDNASLRHGTSVSRHSWKQMIASDLIGEKNEDHA